ncbi:hypothetical protein VN24_03715 [Paenibacillus beijingensis]|uniref:Uncharacterized protein n=1 Tax=Paenibacillus beijingensis TaxID=1126833 RepID=A0A0D5NF61_9BACL|nr:hypothetical protein VN24_03715 [Paenibacillus beijingensis]
MRHLCIIRYPLGPFDESMQALYEDANFRSVSIQAGFTHFVSAPLNDAAGWVMRVIPALKRPVAHE